MRFLNKKGQSSVMAVLTVVIAAVLAIIIVKAFIEAGNLQGTVLTLANTIPYILIAIGIFAGLGALGMFR